MRKFNFFRRLNNSNNTTYVLLCVALLAVVATASIITYFTDGDIAINDLKIGSNVIEIVEEFDPPEEVNPSTEFTKDVKVKNIGLSDCYVRVMAVFDNSHMEQFCEVDWNDTDWVYNPTDGYWYYPDAIARGNSTPSLMTTVKIKDDTPEAAIVDFNIIVYAESVESNQESGFTDYIQAWANYQKNKTN